MPLRTLPDAVLCHFEKEDYLIHQDEKVDFIYYLIKGEVHRELLTPNGREMVLTIKSTNQDAYMRALIGVLVLYDKYEQYGISNCSFIAYTDCLCYRIPVSSYLAFEAEHETEILKQLLSYTMDNYQELFEMYTSKYHKNVSALLCSYILEHTSIQNNQLFFDQKISKVELGKRLDVHPVNISQIISVLIKDGALMKTANRTYLITDHEYIQAIASNELELSYRYHKSDSQ